MSLLCFCVSSKGSGEIVHLHGLAGAFTAFIIIRQVSRVAAHICTSTKSADLVQILNKQDLV